MTDPEKMFPILGGNPIPWRLIEPHRAQALRNHYQTLERLAERGGLSVSEALCVIHDQEAVSRSVYNTFFRLPDAEARELLDTMAAGEVA